MTDYKVNEIHYFDYQVSPLPQVLQYKKGDKVTIKNELGQTVARAEVVSSDFTGYEAKIIMTYGHKRVGPSETK